MGKKDYSNEAIVKLEGPQQVRQKIQMYFGTDGPDGTFHSVLEVLANSIDEAREGFGSDIWLTIHKDNSYTIKDQGRGLPMGMNKKYNEYNYVLTMQTLHAGGKMDNTKADANYENSLGTNGVGLTATNFSSKWLKAESRRDGKIYSIQYKEGTIDGKFKEEKDSKGKNQQTGTIISWLPDDSIFTEINLEKERFQELLRDQAIVNKGLKFHFEDQRDGTKEEYYFPDGILGYAKSLVEDKLTDPIYFEFEGSGKDKPDRPMYKVKGEVVLLFNNSLSESKYYHNASYLKNGGSPAKAKERAMFDFFKDQLKKKGVLKKEFDFKDIQESLLFISNTSSTKTSYQGQTKFAIDNKFIEDFMTAQITKALNDWAKNNPLELDKVNSQVEINQESRLTSASVKQLTKEKLSGGKIKLSSKIAKFTECRSKDNTKTEVFIGEGDSACGSIIQARDAEFQAVFALKGKIANVLKMDLGKILEREVLTNLLKVIGTGISMGDSKKKNQIGDFDINNRRFDKYIFATDQDVDGMHIVSLGLTMFYRLMPELINQGKVYVLDTPLFVLNLKDGKKVYAFSDLENEKLQKEYKDKIKSIDRKKGLGEWKPVDFAYFLDPATRHLTQITMNDIKLAQKNIELMMAEDSDLRKDYIEKHANEYQGFELE